MGPGKHWYPTISWFALVNPGNLARPFTAFWYSNSLALSAFSELLQERCHIDTRALLSEGIQPNDVAPGLAWRIFSLGIFRGYEIELALSFETVLSPRRLCQPRFRWWPKSARMNASGQYKCPGAVIPIDRNFPIFFSHWTPPIK